mgnify:CR=1 FL=1
MLSQELEAITSAKNEEIAKINAETERLNATVAQKEMDLANIGSVIGAIVVVLVLFVLFINCKRAARTVLTGMCYSVGSATRQGSSSLTRFIGQSAMTSRT